MGYTNYFNYTEEGKEFSPYFVGQVKFICKYAMEVNGIELTGKYNEDTDSLEPLNLERDITKNSININGGNGQASESLFLNSEPDDGYDFCKTNEKPYDAVVKAVLMAAQEYEIIKGWKTDNCLNEEKLQNQAKELYKKAKFAFDSYLVSKENGLESFPDDLEKEAMDNLLEHLATSNLDDVELGENSEQKSSNKRRA